MTSPDDLSKELRDALGYNEDVDPELLDMIMTGYDIAGIDVIVAELTYDSLVAQDLVPARDQDVPRMLTAEGGGFTIEFEIAAGTLQVTGRVSPPTAGRIALDQLGNVQEVELSASASFAFVLNPGPFRLRLVTPDGDPIATDWIDP